MAQRVYIKISDIAEKVPVPGNVLQKFEVYYHNLYMWICDNFENRERFKKNATYKINLLMYYLFTDGTVPYNWNTLMTTPNLSCSVNSSDIRRVITKCMLAPSNIDWSECMDSSYSFELANAASDKSSDAVSAANEVPSENTSSKRPYTFSARTDAGAKYSGQVKSAHSNAASVTASSAIATEDKSLIQEDASNGCDDDDEYEIASSLQPVVNATPKEDLFITIPKYPKVADVSSSLPNNIRVSLPLVPSKQSEISATTDVNSMSEDDLLNLFPNTFIRTRSPLMYKPRQGITLDPDYGLLIPVEGFTDAQVRDSIIRYPHIFQLARQMEDGTFTSFYNDMEIDGELVNILKVWKYLPEAKIIDIDSLNSTSEQIEFIKEYAIRRYILERDIAGVKHKFDVRGSLPEFMTLFMPASMYTKEGYGNSIDIAKKCVSARVSYLRTRNPRLVGETPTVSDCMFSPYCCATLCDRSCPKWAQTDYLLMRNGLSYSSRPFRMKQSSLDKYISVYEKACSCGSAVTVTCKDAVKVAEVMSYVAVCNTWQGSAMRVKCYHLLYSQYLESVQSSFGGRMNEDAQYAELWSKSCNVLVISGIDYVNFKDFQSQKLLQLLQDRERKRKATIIVSPKVENIMGGGKMYDLLLSKLRSNLVTID